MGLRVDQLMADIAEVEEETLSVAQAKGSENMSLAIAETFLKRGAEAMGVQLKAKKRKEESLFSCNTSDEEDEEDEEDD
ncbi:hypothetical protein THAOC_21532 [Thalassiosira oceanica]|nr:hypothetical protein THAOC_21532 [Thalassiosira oceanica]|eukprot:EJK58355.1 hypothetical protein THAOC_21532 [Thalassiosira oceanica]